MTRPNVLFLFSDEHSHRFLGANTKNAEDVLTPNLDCLIEQGTFFSDAYCQMPLCTPSRISLLTGKESRRAGAWGNESILRPELDTLPKTFTQNGYSTCLVGKMHLGGNQQMGGFQHRPYGDLTGKCGHQWEPLDKYVETGKNTMRDRTEFTGVTDIPESLIQDVVSTQEGLGWLRNESSTSPDQPWFLCVSFSRPHFPLTAPQRWVDYYKNRGVSEPFVPASGDAFDHPMSIGMRNGFQVDEIDHDEMMQARSSYFACVSYLDEVIGDFLLRLEKDNLLDNTIIVYTSDHGELAGEHGQWWKNGWYEGCTRVPFIISHPEQRKGGKKPVVCDTPVALLDIYPTLCGLCDLEAPQDLDGVDLKAAVDGQDVPERPIFCDSLLARWGEGTEFRSVRLGKYKYVYFRSFEPLMFDLENDPQEQFNLLEREMSAEATEACRTMKEFAESTMDFDKADEERTVRDGKLREVYPQELSTQYRFTNCYTMPDGRIVDADAQLYSPIVAYSDKSLIS